MTVNKEYCMASFLLFRHVAKNDVCWKEGIVPNFKRRDFSSLTKVFSVADIDKSIREQLSKIDLSKTGIMLSGGMDSAILATYLPKGSKAYTMRSVAVGSVNEVEQAKFYAEKLGLDLHIVDVSWQDYLDSISVLANHKKSPFHSIEPLIYKTCLEVKKDGLENILSGENADVMFGGMDGLLEKAEKKVSEKENEDEKSVDEALSLASAASEVSSARREEETSTIIINSEPERKESFRMDTTPITPTAPAQSAYTQNTTQISDENAVITAGMTINGDLESSGSIEVQGLIKGNVTCNGKLVVTGQINGNSSSSEFFADTAKIEGEVSSSGTVKIGAGSVIVGNISATSAVIAGAVKGDIDVQGPVVVDTSAVVMGNIKSRSVQINNGAVIEGFCSQAYADVDVDRVFQ